MTKFLWMALALTVLVCLAALSLEHCDKLPRIHKPIWWHHYRMTSCWHKQQSFPASSPRKWELLNQASNHREALVRRGFFAKQICPQLSLPENRIHEFYQYIVSNSPQLSLEQLDQHVEVGYTNVMSNPTIYVYDKPDRIAAWTNLIMQFK